MKENDINNADLLKMYEEQKQKNELKENKLQESKSEELLSTVLNKERRKKLQDMSKKRKEKEYLEASYFERFWMLAKNLWTKFFQDENAEYIHINSNQSKDQEFLSNLHVYACNHNIEPKILLGVFLKDNTITEDYFDLENRLDACIKSNSLKVGYTPYKYDEYKIEMEGLTKIYDSHKAKVAEHKKQLINEVQSFVKNNHLDAKKLFSRVLDGMHLEAFKLIELYGIEGEENEHVKKALTKELKLQGYISHIEQDLLKLKSEHKKEKHEKEKSTSKSLLIDYLLLKNDFNSDLKKDWEEIAVSEYKEKFEQYGLKERDIDLIEKVRLSFQIDVSKQNIEEKKEKQSKGLISKIKSSIGSLFSRKVN